jgi:proline dehydrogenase
MTAEIENLVLEQLRAIRATQAEHGERLAHIDLQLSAMGQQLAGLTNAVYGGKADLDALRRRVVLSQPRKRSDDNSPDPNSIGGP